MKFPYPSKHMFLQSLTHQKRNEQTNGWTNGYFHNFEVWGIITLYERSGILTIYTDIYIFIKKDRNKLNYRIGPLRSDSVIKLVSDLITESDQAVRAVHSCNSWLLIFVGVNITFFLFPANYLLAIRLTEWIDLIAIIMIMKSHSYPTTHRMSNFVLIFTMTYLKELLLWRFSARAFSL